MTTKTMKELWYSHSKRALQQTGHFRPGDGSTIGLRAHLYERIDKAARKPERYPTKRIAINTDQMDCDCVRYTTGRTMDAVPRRAVERYIEEEVYGAAEGPIYWLSICQPEHKAEHTSRDLALEAFEDGHPHSVSMTRYDEEGAY